MSASAADIIGTVMAGMAAMAGTAVGMAGAATAGAGTAGAADTQNVGAVWIETASGTFVKTVEKWGSIRAMGIM